MNTPPTDIYDGDSQPLRLGSLLGRGGEAAVYEVVTDQTSAAKIYNRPLSKDKAEKIRLMAANRNPRLEKLVAWPRNLVIRRSGEPIGLLMPKIADRKDIHHLYSPRSRRTVFLRANWRFLIHAATNIARAFRVVHEAGYVIGDVNHGSILVGQDATVRLIDCDSFQVISGDRRFLCEVGVETFTPPELQEKDFSRTVRSAHHDNFGLAVMIFLMLFMGRHPFAGRYLGQGEMPISRAIRECRFPYGSQRTMIQMEPPPGTPPLSIVGNSVAQLFERAFAREGIRDGRPDAATWASCLEALEKNTDQCTTNPSHWYLKDLRSCPWCVMEAQTGVSLFPWTLQQAGTTVNLEALWTQIRAIPHPGPAPSITSTALIPSDAAKRLKGWHSRRMMIAACAAVAPWALLMTNAKIPGFWIFVASVAAFAIAYRLSDQSQEIAEMRRRRDVAAGDWSRIEDEWQSRAGSQSFDAKRSELERLKQELDRLPDVRLRKLDELKVKHWYLQLEEFLDQFELERATIPHIGPGRKQTLSSYGIETAADISESRVTSVPGFGPANCARLMDWRASIEAQFRFDPARRIDPQHPAKIEQDILSERRRIEDRLRAGSVELRAICNQIVATRQQMKPQVDAAYTRHLQATADFEIAKE